MTASNSSSGVRSMAEPASGARHALRGLRIMVVDDVEDARDMIGEILTMSGAEVVSVASVREAMQCIEEQPPHAIITDISMPQEDGYAFIRALRKLTPDKGGTIPVVALTAHASQAVTERILSAGFQLHLAKPVDLLALPSQVIGLIAGNHAQT